ncbi:MAG: tRNA lysidine(34) synthetase TilS [Oscillospiraceae bacterium]|nr:tRNA lysidine(34) synthetase TilS [Oscillospiraceae bacterium]
MKLRVTETISKFDMLTEGENVVVGVSGGIDSVSLLHFLVNYTLERDLKLNLLACHINHEIRGEEAKRDEMFVAKFCGELRVEFFVRHANIPQMAKNQKLSVEECARKERYRILGELAKELKAKIATAHTLNDSMETFFLNIGRGTGLCGMCGIPPVRDNIIRPFILVSRKEIERYAKENALSHIEDSSNNDTGYTRNFIRQCIVPRFYDLNASFEPLFRRMCRNLQEDEKFIAEHAEKIWANISLSAGKYDLSSIKSLHNSLKFRVVKKILEDAGVPCDEAKIKLIEQMIESGNGKLAVGKDLFIRASESFLTVEKVKKVDDKKRQPAEIEINLPGSYELLGNKKIEFKFIDRQEYEKIAVQTDVRANVLSCDELVGKLTLRTRQPGDKIKLNRYGCTKTLKNLFLEHKIPKSKRDEYQLLEDEKGLVWIEEFGCATRVAVGEDTKRILLITIDGRL